MASNDLWELCSQFKSFVCSTINSLSPQFRESLKGDYVFFISNEPKFIVMVEKEGSWSLFIKNINRQSELEFEIDSDFPHTFTAQNIATIIETNSRATVKTDSLTLQRLLLGTMKAKVAFLTGKVQIFGDFPAFLKLVSQLKKSGVGPIKNKPGAQTIST